jgi:hypothetical protein
MGLKEKLSLRHKQRLEARNAAVLRKKYAARKVVVTPIVDKMFARIPNVK